jgi:hypothetical protein
MYGIIKKESIVMYGMIMTESMVMHGIMHDRIHRQRHTVHCLDQKWDPNTKTNVKYIRTKCIGHSHVTFAFSPCSGM